MNVSIWTPEQQAVLVEMAAARAKVADIASALGFTRNAVIGRARRTGVALLYEVPRAEPRAPRPPRVPRVRGAPRVRLPQSTIEHVRALYLEGATYGAIARAAGVAQGNVAYLVRGLPRRRAFKAHKRYDFAFRVSAVAAILTGESYAKASRRQGCEEKSILSWKARPEVFEAATALAERIKARFAAEQERLRLVAEAEAEAERVRVATVNAPVFAQMGIRHRNILQRRVDGETLEAIGQDYGITRERVRQIEVKWRLRGLEVPGARPLTEAASRVVYVPTGKPRGRKPKVESEVDFWTLAHAISERPEKGQRRAMRLTPAERQRRSDNMRNLWATRREEMRA
jgi:hypothetical protein